MKKSNLPLLTRRAAHRVLPLEARLMFDAAAATEAVRTTEAGAIDAAVAPATAAAPAEPSRATDEHPVLSATNPAQVPAAQQPTLTSALEQVNATLGRLPDTAGFSDLLTKVYGSTGTDAATFAQRVTELRDALAHGGLQIQVELRSGAELHGAFAAYTARGPDGQERIYLNADWVAHGAAAGDVAARLLEEVGHAIDQRLNGGVDTAGDEGERFSALVRGQTLTDVQDQALLADADQDTLTIDGHEVDVEYAELSVPFSEGFIGTKGTNSNQANGVFNFSTLGIVRASFFQDSGSGQFTLQGNDIPGGLRITLTSGRVITVTGAINWRVTAGSSLYCFGFVPDASTAPVSFSYGNGSTFTLSNTSNFGLELVGVSYSTADNSNINGNAATTGLLSALNGYLAQVQANDPNGPVTVDSLATTDTTPTLTGTATLNGAAGETLSVSVNGVTYTSGNGLSLVGTNWSLTIPDGSDLSSGTYSVTATITNNLGYTLTDSTASELIVDGTAPVVTGGQSFSYAENQTAGATIATVAATDNVGVTGYRFSSTGTATSADGFFTINSSGQVSLTTAGAAAAANDYEALPNAFTMGVQARDAVGNWSNAVNVTLNVTDADEVAPVVAGNQSFSYAENRTAGAALGTVSATDNVAVTGYRFGSTGTSTSADGYFSINASGQISLTAAGAAAGASANDYETLPNAFTLGVQARDAAGNWSSAVNVTLNVTDLDDTAPVVAANQSFSYAENQTAGTVLGTVSATDAVGVTGYRFSSTGTSTSSNGYFSLDSSGQISLTTAGAAAGASANDYETLPNAFTLGVQARDAAGNWSSAVNVTLNVTDLDDTAPVVAANQSFSYAENQTAGTVLGTVSATDAVGVTGYRFSSTGTSTSSNGYFSLDSSGQISLTTAGAAAGASANDYETLPNAFTLGVQARDAAGNWSSAVNVTLNVTDLDDTAPVVAANQSFSYAENRTAGSALGTVSAGDNVAVTGYRFSDTGTTTSADGCFSIDSSGRISLTSAGAAAAANDYEALPNSFTLGVQARDAAGNWSGAVNVTLNVTDLDEVAPVVAASQAFSYAENRTAGAVLGTVTASDNVSVTGYRFGDTGTTTSADGWFSIDSSGNISLTGTGAAAAANDYETLPNGFALGVQARDAAGNWSGSVDVTLAVTDLVESAAVADSAQSAEDTPVTGNVLANDLGTNLHVVSFEAGGASSAAGGTLTLAGIGSITIAADGAYTFVPAADWHGAVPSINYLTDSGRTAVLDLTVMPANDAPALSPDALTTFQDVPWEGQLPAGTDADGDTLSYGLVQGPSHGSVSLAADGHYHYVPEAGYSGLDRFRVEVSDGLGGTAQVWVDVTVAPTPTIGLPAPWDLGPSSTDRSTSADVITLAGSGTPGQTLRLYDPAGQLVATTVVDPQGHWSVAGIDMRTLTGDVAGRAAGDTGAYTFTLRAALPGGVLSTPVALTVQREAEPPRPATPAEPATLPVAEAPPVPAPAAPPEPAVLSEAPRAFDSALQAAEARPELLLVAMRPQDLAGSAAVPLLARDNNAADIYTRPSGFQIMVNPSPEPALKLFRGLDDQVAKVGTTVQLQVPADTFVHTNVHETVVLQATLADGRPLPRWLQFDGRTGTLSGDVPAQWRDDLVIRVVARDSQGREASAMMRVKMGAGPAGGAGLSRQLMQGRGAPLATAPRAPTRD